MSNDRLKRTLEFDLADAPMMMAAMRLAAATAMMCGHRDAEKKLRFYQRALQQFIPEAAEAFEEEVWSEMGMALINAESFRVTIEPKRWEQSRTWWDEGVLTVHVGERRFAGDKGVRCYVKRGVDAAPKALFEALCELAPMDCQGSWDSAKRN